MSQNSELELAEQQLIGFGHASKGYGVIDLITSMGLKKSEFEKIRKHASVWLKESDFDQVENYFAALTAGTNEESK